MLCAGARNVTNMRKRLIVTLILITSLAAIAVLSACGFVEVHDVNLHFVIDGVAFRDMTVSAYASSGLDVGVKVGYVFDGWYADPEYTRATNPSKVTSDATLYGHWVKEQIKTATYTVTFLDDDGSLVGTVQASSLADIRYPTPPEKENYVFSEWTGRPAVLLADVTLTATYRRLYTVTFYSEDGEELYVQKVPEGSFATPPIPPRKEGDDEYSYEFYGWEAEEGNYNVVQMDLAVYATYRSITNRYTYSLYLENGEKTITRTADYGTQVTLPEPEKASTVDKTYTFAGWDTNRDGVVDKTDKRLRLYADFEAWAVYTENARVYSVQFDMDGTVYAVDVVYGEEAAYPAETAPARLADAQYTYAFDGWDTDADGVADEGLEFIASDVYAVAVFAATTNWYTYQFVLPDDTPYAEEVYAPYGTLIVPPETNPEKEANESFAYSFSYWDGYEEEMTLSEDVTFKAVFSMHVRLYTISFKYKGSTLLEYRLPYGTVIDYDEMYKPCPFPVYPDEDDKAYAYSWDNWAPNYVVTKDFRFNLSHYSAYDYVVTWQIDADHSFDTYYREGDLLALPKEPTLEGFIFAEWEGYDASTRVEGNMTMLAVFVPVEQ